MVKDLRIAVDIGGTFTDVTLYDPASGRLIVGKTPSTPHDPSEGFGNGLGTVLAEARLGGEAVGALSSRDTGRNLNLILILIFGLRLMLGGGFI